MGWRALVVFLVIIILVYCFVMFYMNELSLNFEQILQLIKQLPSQEKIRLNRELEKDISQEIEDFHLTKVYTKISEASFQKVWENPEDADYDNL